MAAARPDEVEATTHGEDKAEEAKVKLAQPPVSESRDTDLVTIGKDGVELQWRMVEHQEPQRTPESEDGKAMVDGGAPLVTDEANSFMLEEGSEMETIAEVGRTSADIGYKEAVVDAPPVVAIRRHL